MKLFDEFRKSNRGASLVLVSSLCLIILTIAVTLTLLSSMLLSSAQRRKSQDQAYELATSMSNKIEELILNGTDKAGELNLNVTNTDAQDGLKHNSCISLESYLTADPTVPATITELNNLTGITNSSVIVEVCMDETGNYYIVTVTAKAAEQTYICTNEYIGSSIQGYSRK